MGKTAAKYVTNEELIRSLHVSEEALQRFRNDRADPLPHLKAGRRYLYLPEEVEKWMRRQAQRQFKRQTARG